MNWRTTEAKGLYLVLVTGFVFGSVRHGVHKRWDSWEQILVYWFVHTWALLLFALLAGAAIIYSHRLFLGYDYDTQKESPAALFFTS